MGQSITLNRPMCSFYKISDLISA